MRVGDTTMRDGKISTDTAVKLEKSERATDHRKAERTAGERTNAEEAPSPFARILHGLGREVDRGETLVRRATTAGTSGQEIGSMELLALQAGVYRYSEAVDLSAKLVDRAASGVKTVLQGQ